MRRIMLTIMSPAWYENQLCGKGLNLKRNYMPRIVDRSFVQVKEPYSLV
jgi:hypothetical protein